MPAASPTPASPGLLSARQAVMPAFDNLVSVDAATRLAAAEVVVDTISRAAEAKDAEAEGLVAYCVTRLLKGLASSREAARQGFAV